MRFIDEATIRVSGGHGGPGCVSFRRETFVPRGGPDGGDGGDGGDVIFVANKQLSSLQDFRYKREYKAPAGMHGSGANKAGKDGENIELKIPVGTLIREAETGEILVDFTEDGQIWIACEGGRGGKGNAHFVTSTFQAPKFAQPGEDGQAREIKLELKLLADVAIVGFPNAGKSTFISRVSAARPKIADYPFTTLTPNLGVVALDDHQSFVIADIPGLIEGAHRGLGLGHRFLKHIERTRVFIHLLDGSQFLEDATRPDLEDRSDVQAKLDSFDEAIEKLVHRYTAIRQELGLFNEALLHKPEIVVLNKLDVLESDRDLVERARKALRERIAGIRHSHPQKDEPYVISAVAGTGVKELIGAIWEQNPMNRPVGWSEVTAVLGGTFDPPHLGHREAVRGLFENPGVRRVLVMPSGTPPLKPGATSGEHRFRMAELAFAGLERFGEVRIERRELERAERTGKPSYTIDTLLELEREFPDLAFVMGADQLSQLHLWHRFPELLGAARWIVLKRKETPESEAMQVLRQWEASGLIKESHLKLVETPAQALSSSAIRQDIARSVDREELRNSLERKLLPAVLAYLMENGLYGISKP